MWRWGRNKPAIVDPGPAQDKAGRGARAEALAAAHLQAAGLALVARNVRCRGGEVDLIVQEGAWVVFVEVRLRSHPDYGGGAESITAAKRARVILAARHWLAGAGARYAGHPCRFDVVLLDALAADRLTWLRNAFSA